MSLRQFVKKHGVATKIYDRTGAQLPYTNLNLAGGDHSALNVPPELYDQYLRAIALELDRGEDVFQV